MTGFFPKDQRTRIEEARAAQAKFLEGLEKDKDARREEKLRQAEQAKRQPFSHITWNG